MTCWKVTSKASTKSRKGVFQGTGQFLWATVSLELVPGLNSCQRSQTTEKFRGSYSDTDASLGNGSFEVCAGIIYKYCFPSISFPSNGKASS